VNRREHVIGSASQKLRELQRRMGKVEADARASASPEELLEVAYALIAKYLGRAAAEAFAAPLRAAPRHVAAHRARLDAAFGTPVPTKIHRQHGALVLPAAAVVRR